MSHKFLKSSSIFLSHWDTVEKMATAHIVWNQCQGNRDVCIHSLWRFTSPANSREMMKRILFSVKPGVNHKNQWIITWSTIIVQQYYDSPEPLTWADGVLFCLICFLFCFVFCFVLFLSPETLCTRKNIFLFAYS